MDQPTDLVLGPSPTPPPSEPGTTTVSLRASSTAKILDTFAHDEIPVFASMVADAAPYRLHKAKGLLLNNVPYSSIWAALAELDDAWSRLNDAQRSRTSIADVMIQLRHAGRWPAHTPRVEGWNHSFTNPIAQATKRHARWRRVAESAAFRFALSDRFVAAVATGAPQLRWSYASAYRLLGLEQSPPPYLAILPAGSLLWNPTPVDLLPGPHATDETIEAFLSALVHLPLIADLSVSGYLTAAEAMNWLTSFLSLCVTDFQAGAPERAQAYRRVQALISNHLTLHTVTT